MIDHELEHQNDEDNRRTEERGPLILHAITNNPPLQCTLSRTQLPLQ